MEQWDALRARAKQRRIGAESVLIAALNSVRAKWNQTRSAFTTVLAMTSLASCFSARIMLCGRRRMGAAVDARLAALRSLAADIAYMSANVTRRPEVRRLVGETRSRFGPLNGIFHCAGVLRDGLLAYPETCDLVEVARPKLLGARYLDLETREAARE